MNTTILYPFFVHSSSAQNAEICSWHQKPPLLCIFALKQSQKWCIIKCIERKCNSGLRCPETKGETTMADKNFLTEIIDADLAEARSARSIPASRRSPTATCTSAAPRPSTSTGPSQTSMAASSTCAWTTPTPPARVRSMSTASLRICTGWALTPTAASSMAAITLTSATSTPRSSSWRQGLRGRPDP